MVCAPRPARAHLARQRVQHPGLSRQSNSIASMRLLAQVVQHVAVSTRKNCVILQPRKNCCKPSTSTEASMLLHGQTAVRHHGDGLPLLPHYKRSQVAVAAATPILLGCAPRSAAAPAAALQLQTATAAPPSFRPACPHQHAPAQAAAAARQTAAPCS